MLCFTPVPLVLLPFFVFNHQAKLIEFQPLRATDVKLPEGAVFVISNCCVEMNKAASSHFNIRVVECRIATKVNILNINRIKRTESTSHVGNYMKA